MNALIIRGANTANTDHSPGARYVRSGGTRLTKLGFMAVIGLLVLGACGESTHAYPPSAIDEWMDSCQDGSLYSSGTRCACMIEGFQKHFTYAEFRGIQSDLERDIDRDDDLLAVIEYASECSQGST